MFLFFDETSKRKNKKSKYLWTNVLQYKIQSNTFLSLFHVHICLKISNFRPMIRKISSKDLKAFHFFWLSIFFFSLIFSKTLLLISMIVLLIPSFLNFESGGVKLRSVKEW